MTQKPKPDWAKLLAPTHWKMTPTHWKMTAEERQAKIDEQRKKENEAAIRHKQLTAIYIDRIDDAFRYTKFKDTADVAAFHFKHRPSLRIMSLDFVSFYDGVLSVGEADDDAKLVWNFVDRYFQERLELKDKYVRGL